MFEEKKSVSLGKILVFVEARYDSWPSTYPRDLSPTKICLHSLCDDEQQDNNYISDLSSSVGGPS
jgi:hypothetical protein